MKRTVRNRITIVFAIVIFIFVGMISHGVKAETIQDGYEETNDLTGNMLTSTGYFSYNATSSNPHRLGKVTASGTSLTFVYYCPTAGKARFKVYSDSSYSSLVGYIDTPVAGTTGTQFISSISVTKWHDYYLEVVPCGGYAHTAGSFTLTY